MSNHSVIEHRANYYFLKLEEDYLHICQGDHCKAAILSILEQWMNDKKSKGRGEYVYMTYPLWIESMYGLYGRSYIMTRLDALEKEGLLSKRPYRHLGRLDTFEYTLNIAVIQELLRALPEKQPHDTRPNLNGCKNKRVQNQTGVNLDGSPVQNKTGDGFKNGRNIESITQNTDTLDHSLSPNGETPASAVSPSKNFSYLPDFPPTGTVPAKPPSSNNHHSNGHKPTGDTLPQLTFAGSHLLEVYETFKKRPQIPTVSLYRAANLLGNVVTNDEVFVRVLVLVRDDPFLNKKKIRRSLEWIMEHYDTYVDIVELDLNNGVPAAKSMEEQRREADEENLKELARLRARNAKARLEREQQQQQQQGVPR